MRLTSKERWIWAAALCAAMVDAQDANDGAAWNFYLEWVHDLGFGFHFV